MVVLDSDWEGVALLDEGVCRVGSEADVCVTVTMDLSFWAGKVDGGRFSMRSVSSGHELEHFGK